MGVPLILKELEAELVFVVSSTVLDGELAVRMLVGMLLPFEVDGATTTLGSVV